MTQLYYGLSRPGPYNVFIRKYKDTRVARCPVVHRRRFCSRVFECSKNETCESGLEFVNVPKTKLARAHLNSRDARSRDHQILSELMPCHNLFVATLVLLRNSRRARIRQGAARPRSPLRANRDGGASGPGRRRPTEAARGTQMRLFIVLRNQDRFLALLPLAGTKTGRCMSAVAVPRKTPELPETAARVPSILHVFLSETGALGSRVSCPSRGPRLLRSSAQFASTAAAVRQYCRCIPCMPRGEPVRTQEAIEALLGTPAGCRRRSRASVATQLLA